MNFLSTERKAGKARIVGLALCFALAVSLNVAGQVAGTASLAGKITDPTGAVIVGAEVTATHAGTGTVRSAKSDQRGRYLLAQLPPGTYKIDFKANGFKTGVRERPCLCARLRSHDFPAGCLRQLARRQMRGCASGHSARR